MNLLKKTGTAKEKLVDSNVKDKISKSIKLTRGLKRKREPAFQKHWSLMNFRQHGLWCSNQYKTDALSSVAAEGSGSTVPQSNSQPVKENSTSQD